MSGLTPDQRRVLQALVFTDLPGQGSYALYLRDGGDVARVRNRTRGEAVRLPVILPLIAGGYLDYQQAFGDWHAYVLSDTGHAALS